MAYNPGNMAAMALAAHNAQAQRAQQAQMFNVQRADTMALDDKARREQEKQAAAVVKGFRQVWEASPELQQAMPIKDWNDMSPNQVKGMIDGLASLQQQQAAQQALAKAAAQQRQAQAAQTARARALASAYGGGSGGQPALAPRNDSAVGPGVFAVGANGQIATLQGGQQPFLPSGGGAQQPAGALGHLGPAAVYARSLLQQGVAPSEKEAAAALQALRRPQVIGSGANQFMVDANGNMQRMNQQPDTQKGPQVSPDGRFYATSSGWKPIPGAGQQAKPLVKLDPYELGRNLKKRSELRGTIEELASSKRRKDKEAVADARATLQSIEAVLAAGGYSTMAQAPAQRPRVAAPLQPGVDAPKFVNAEDAEKSGHKGFAYVAGRPAWID